MKKKQKIIIVSNNLVTGGIQKALVNLLNEIKNEYDITLFLFSDYGDYQNLIPDTIKVVKANPHLKLLGISQRESKNIGSFHYIFRAILVIWTKIFNNNLPIQFLLLTEFHPKKYDIAISYVHSAPDKLFYGGCNEFVLRKIDALKKCAFIHCDYLNYGGNTQKNRKMYQLFDCIATVSDGCKKQFIKAIPELTNKTHTVQNCHNYPEIKREANTLPMQYDSENFNILTVARLSEEKGIIRTIDIISQLTKDGYKICWHLIGEGSLRSEIENLVATYGLEGKIILHGNQNNPYKFMVNADLFLLPSFHEAAPMVFSEAKCIGLPILTTNTTSAIEMIEKNNAGWTCDNSVDGIKIKLKYILDNQEELFRIRKSLKNQNFNNELSLKQFNYVLNGV